MQRRTLLFAALLPLSSTRLAFAHGEAAHDKTQAPAKAEQKPWGIAGNPKAVSRTVQIVMSDDMRFTPDRIALRQGDTLKLVLRNDGKLLHELVIGTRKVLDEHAALMAKFPTMEHDEPYMAHVKPGETGSIVWRFNRAGTFDFACLIAGHYQAGMRGKIIVGAR